MDGGPAYHGVCNVYLMYTPELSYATGARKGESEQIDESDCSLANLGLLAYLGHSLAKDKHLMSDLFAARFTLFTLILTILTIED